jgi:hypothetical protein
MGSIAHSFPFDICKVLPQAIERIAQNNRAHVVGKHLAGKNHRALAGRMFHEWNHDGHLPITETRPKAHAPKVSASVSHLTDDEDNWMIATRASRPSRGSQLQRSRQQQ